MVTAEEEVDTLVGVEPKELPDDLNGEDLGVGELRSGTALANAASLELVVHEAEEIPPRFVLLPAEGLLMVG